MEKLKVHDVVQAVLKGTYGFVPLHLFFNLETGERDPVFYSPGGAPAMTDVAAKYLRPRSGKR